MKTNEDGSELTISAEQADAIIYFIDRALDRSWDHYTDHYICEGINHEDGKRRMDPEAYDLMQELRSAMYNY